MKSHKKELELYADKSAEFVSEILSRETYCSCIMDVQESLIDKIEAEMPEFNIKKFLKTELKLANDNELNQQIELSKNFKLSQHMIPSDLKIIQKPQWDSIVDQYWVNGVSIRKSIYKMCPKGVLSISKPIFNKNYTSVVFDNDDGGCLKIGPWAYHQLKNGKWLSE
ncbi:hypothetical protein [uncultured Psychroserpens sp.]|uniref:hypothetical protein n=1 Tax=uncultured Psychroserpens sp. TaxID=255436 RepID=UPI00261D707D|nr:hypothetical protein [uncultured Psychroserpens sp.]